jgi:DNA-binding GntR family transcriptional regulator
VESPRTGREPSRVDRAAGRLRDAIRHGRYVPGQRLVEIDLIAELNISRPSLREVLRRLAGEGLVTIQPHQGAAVRRWSRREIDETFAIRELLEGEAARLAALHVDQNGHRDQFEAALREFRDLLERPVGALDYDERSTRLHDLIIASSGNRQLSHVTEALHIQAIRHEAGRLWSAETIRQSVQRHIAVLELVLASDPEGAEQAMKHHIRVARAKLLQLLDQQA